MAPTNYEMIFWAMSVIGTICTTLVTIRNYNINERIRVFGHD